MNYLKSFTLLSVSDEENKLHHEADLRVYNNFYPYRIFPKKKLTNIIFDSITIFYGNNGSGKTTLLNIIAEKINSTRRNEDENKGMLFDSYVEDTDFSLDKESLKENKIILSDDVFDLLLDTKAINSNVNRRKEEFVDEYNKVKYDTSNIESALEQYEDLRKRVNARKMTKSKYTRTELGNNNIISKSNGESAIEFWENQITDNGIYLLDEPENSLSSRNQLRLKSFIEDAVKYHHCQFIIATHSPFFLALDHARIYDLDSSYVEVTKWYKLDNMKIYYDFFKEYSDSFERNNNDD